MNDSPKLWIDNWNAYVLVDASGEAVLMHGATDAPLKKFVPKNGKTEVVNLPIRRGEGKAGGKAGRTKTTTKAVAMAVLNARGLDYDADWPTYPWRRKTDRTSRYVVASVNQSLDPNSLVFVPKPAATWMQRNDSKVYLDGQYLHVAYAESDHRIGEVMPVTGDMKALRALFAEDVE